MSFSVVNVFINVQLQIVIFRAVLCAEKVTVVVACTPYVSFALNCSDCQ